MSDAGLHGGVLLEAVSRAHERWLGSFGKHTPGPEQQGAFVEGYLKGLATMAETLGEPLRATAVKWAYREALASLAGVDIADVYRDALDEEMREEEDE